MKIEIWSDVVCPFCWIGKRRFENALALLGDQAPSLSVEWKPFQLDPDASEVPVPLREAYAAKFGGLARTDQLLAQTQANAQSEGLPMDFSQGQVKVSTVSAHRLLGLAGREGDQNAVAEALFRAHFAQGNNIADPAVLVQAGLAGGLSAERVTAMLDSEEGLAEVHEGQVQAQALGISSVPTFIIDGRYAISGAQPAQVFAEILAKIAAEHPPQAPVSGATACGPDGCEI